MNDIKGFFNIPRLTNNNSDSVAKFGELSPVSKTFTRDPRTYESNSAPNVILSTFRAVNDAGDRLPLPPAVTNRILLLGQWLYNRYDAATIPNQIQSTLLVGDITNEFGFTGVSIGTISAGTVASKRLPSWVRFVMVEATVSYQVKIWLEDEAFASQYEHRVIFAIPPTPQVDDLRLDIFGLTQVLTSANAVSSYVLRESQITQNYPKTALVNYTLTWHDLSDPNRIMDTTWVLVVYGNAGTDQEAIKEAIREYIATQSSQGQWDIIYPSLYSENEFAVVPLWETLAVPETGGLQQLFSPTVTLAEMSSLSRPRLPVSYAPNTAQGNAHLSNNLRFMPTNYRQVGCLILGNPNNASEVSDIKDLFPDITAILSTSGDYSRMEADTRTFLELLMSALNEAYTVNINSVLPAQFTRAVRNNRIYVSFLHVGYQFMVLARISY